MCRGDELCVDYQPSCARDAGGGLACVVADYLPERQFYALWAFNEASPWSSHYDLIQQRASRAELARHSGFVSPE